MRNKIREEKTKEKDLGMRKIDSESESAIFVGAIGKEEESEAQEHFGTKGAREVKVTKEILISLRAAIRERFCKTSSALLDAGASESLVAPKLLAAALKGCQKHASNVPMIV